MANTLDIKRDAVPEGRGFYPVIHHTTIPTTLSNAAMAMDVGATGVFLIQMEGRDEELFPVAQQLRDTYPTLWLGVNLLATPLLDALLSATRSGLFQGLWSDNPGLHSTHGSPDRVNQTNQALELVKLKRPDFRFFGSVAFKTQPPEPDPALVALAAAQYGWTPTTSGSATGVAADPERLAQMKMALSPLPHSRLAVASGIASENVTDYACIDDFLVATGISADFYTFDYSLIGRLANQIQALGRPTLHSI